MIPYFLAPLLSL